MIKQLAAAAITGGLVLGAGSLAWAGTGSSSTPSATAPRASAGIGPRGLLRRVEHGDLTIKTKNGVEQVTLDRGTVTGVSATSITIRRPDGVSVTKTIDASTRFRGVDSAADIQTGQPAIVVSKGDSAVVICQRYGKANA